MKLLVTIQYKQNVYHYIYTCKNGMITDAQVKKEHARIEKIVRKEFKNVPYNIEILEDILPLE
jgi:hypothetical protein